MFLLRDILGAWWYFLPAILTFHFLHFSRHLFSLHYITWYASAITLFHVSLPPKSPADIPPRMTSISMHSLSAWPPSLLFYLHAARIYAHFAHRSDIVIIASRSYVVFHIFLPKLQITPRDYAFGYLTSLVSLHRCHFRRLLRIMRDGPFFIFIWASNTPAIYRTAHQYRYYFCVYIFDRYIIDIHGRM